MLDLRNIVDKALSDYKMHFAIIEADVVFMEISCYNLESMYAVCDKYAESEWKLKFICDEKMMEDTKRYYQVHGFKIAII